MENIRRIIDDKIRPQIRQHIVFETMSVQFGRGINNDIYDLIDQQMRQIKIPINLNTCNN